MKLKAVIFDLDGVIVSTDEFHYLAWKKIADQEGIPFNREMNHRQRGVSRMASLEVLLEKATKKYSPEEKAKLAEVKNEYYRSLLAHLTPKDMLEGVMETLQFLKNAGVKIAIGSSSKNTQMILKHIGLDTYFDAVADGNDIVHSKPNPEVFLIAAKRLEILPQDCAVVEDAQVGIEAAKAGKMVAIAIHDAKNSFLSDYRIDKLSDIIQLFSWQ